MHFRRFGSLVNPPVSCVVDSSPHSRFRCAERPSCRRPCYSGAHVLGVASRAAFSMLCILAFFSPSLGRCDDKSEKAVLDTARAAVDFYAGSIKTLSGKSIVKLRGEPDRDKHFPGELRMQNVRIEETFEADVPSRRTRLEERKSFFYRAKDGGELPMETHLVGAFNGVKFFFLVHTQARSAIPTQVPLDTPVTLNITPGDDFDKEYVPWDFAGLRAGYWANLAVFLRTPKLKIGPAQEVNGARCVAISDHRSNGQVMAVWLDPEHDFLPRRIELTGVDAEGKRSLQDRFEILDFGKFPDEESGTDKWFPTRVETHNWIMQISEVEVVELRINPPIDPARFTIADADLPDGVGISDRTQGHSGRFTGDRKDIWEERQKLRRRETEQLESLIAVPERPVSRPRASVDDVKRDPTVTVTSPSTHWSIWAIGAVSIALIAAGSLRLVRSRKARGAGRS